MFYVRTTKVQNNKQTNDLILQTKDERAAYLAFEGTLIGLRYTYKDKIEQERVEKNKVQLRFKDTIITITVKEK